ncbi:GAP family protein [Cyanobium sp. NIES-981]|uniref:GAP family protein n=1 Tax=Cyanobium sp. NIES-981 TaxID=1851505 RepID=UPI0007DE02B9|nr:GAP family protein [Cyanobium sp. NIES-981]SBO42929.1 conserved membrane protein of unknown function [Cyanobium sp. NIES-981]
MTLAALDGSTTQLLEEIGAFGLAVALSPAHIVLLLLVLLGERPRLRGTAFVLAWLATSALVVAALLTVGHGLLLSMERGSAHRTGLDLIAAGGLLGLGLRELLNRSAEAATPGWADKLEQFCALPLPLLLALSSAFQIASPDDLFLFARTAAGVLEAKLGPGQEVLATVLFSLVSSLLLLAPLLALLLLGPERMLPQLRRGKTWLLARGDAVVGLVSLALAGYLGWQGIEGLQLRL